MVIDASGVKPNITNFELSPRVNLDTNKFVNFWFIHSITGFLPKKTLQPDLFKLCTYYLNLGLLLPYII